MIVIVLENLRNGRIRVTGRHRGMSLGYADGHEGEEKELTLLIMNRVASAHRYPSGEFDMTYIELNEGAKAALESK